jgi:hypothetical protein
VEGPDTGDEDDGELKKRKVEEVRRIKNSKRWNSKRKREETKTKKAGMEL